jgi:hypothetical protein
MLLYIGLLFTCDSPVFGALVVYQSKNSTLLIVRAKSPTHLVPLGKTGHGSQTVDHRITRPHCLASLACPGYE